MPPPPGVNGHVRIVLQDQVEKDPKKMREAHPVLDPAGSMTVQQVMETMSVEQIQALAQQQQRQEFRRAANSVAQKAKPLAPVKESDYEILGSENLQTSDQMEISRMEKEWNMSAEQATYEMMMAVYGKMWQGSKTATINHMLAQANPEERSPIMDFAAALPDDIPVDA